MRGFGKLGVCSVSVCLIALYFLKILVHVFGVHRTLNVNDLRYDHLFFNVYLSILFVDSLKEVLYARSILFYFN